MSFQPPTKRDTQSYTIAPRAPGAPPRGYYDTSMPRWIRWILLGGAVLLVVGCAGVAGLGYWVFVANSDDEDSASLTPEADGDNVVLVTATPLIIGQVSSPTVFVFSTVQPVSSPAITGDSVNLPPTNTSEVSIPNLGPSATFTFVPPTLLPATNTLSPTSTPLPSHTPSATPTPTSPSASITPVVFNTSGTGIIGATTISTSPPSPLPPNTPLASPTLTPLPVGDLLRFIYDDSGFYVWNGADERLSLSRLGFEAVDANGFMVDFKLSGERWAQFYPYLEAGKCAAVELTDAVTNLRPAECRGFNAILTPERRYTINFWLSRPEATGFRVLWDSVVIGQCPTGQNTCEVILPH